MKFRLRASTVSATALAYLAATASAAAVVGLGWLAWQRYERTLVTEQHAEFVRVADQSALSLIQRTVIYRNALLGLRASFLSSRAIRPDEFARYVQALDLGRNLRGLRAFAFNRHLDDVEIGSYVARLRTRLADFSPAYATFEIEPPGRRAEYHVVELIQPASGNERALGFDLWHNPARREAIERARSEGFAATAPIHLRQEPSTVSVLMLAPVPDPEGLEAPAARHTVAASFRAADLVDSAIAPAFRQRFFLRVTDFGPSNAPMGNGEPVFRDELPEWAGDPFASEFAVGYDEIFGGRRWRIEFAPRIPPDEAGRTDIFAVGIAALALLVAVVVVLSLQRIQRRVRLEALADLASDSEFALDADGVVCAADASVGRITGRALAQWEGKPLWTGVFADDTEHVRQAVQAATDRKKPIVVEFRVCNATGTPRWFSARIGNHLDHPLIGQLLVQVSDIDGRKTAEAEIARMAYYDPLTDLPNRRLLEERARQVLSAARRKEHRAAVLVLDLDGFKDLNDGAGHGAGDEALCIVSRRLVASVREIDTVARLGGDEFVVLLAEPSGEAEVQAAARRIAAAIAQPIELVHRHWHLTVSIGAALYPDHGSEFGTLLSIADTAMYCSKRAGRDTFTLADA